MRVNSDRLIAALWAVFGAMVVIASWRLDRLENLHINPWSAPGLTPGIVGLLMILLAIGIAIQSDRAKPSASGPAEPSVSPEAGPPEGKHSRTLVASILCVLFAGVSLGRGLPFVVEGAVFILVFISVFSWSQWRAQGRVVRGLLTTLVIALVSSGLISWLFESVFLVRLP